MAAQLLDQVKELAAGFAQKQRLELIKSLRSLAISLETPQDSLQRVMYSTLELPLARIGCDLHLFKIFVESKGPLTVAQLAGKTKADPVLLARLVRAMAALLLIKEVDKDTFAASNVSESFIDPGMQAGVYHYFDVVGPVYQNLPEFLKETNYVEPKDWSHTAYQRTHNTDLPAFVHSQTRPGLLQNFALLMAARRAGESSWLDGYPIPEKTKGLKRGDQPLFIDMGGGVGHESLSLRDRYPDLPGAVVVQEIQATLDALPPSQRRAEVEYTVHDFFTPQPIKGARFYYMRNIMHDYPDDKCVEIIGNIIPAMAEDSLILIDDIVLPDVGVPPFATALDITMMCYLGARERTMEHWTNLMEKAGLKINEIYTYRESQGDSVLEVVPK